MTTNQMSIHPHISILDLPPSPVLHAEDPNKNLRIRIEKLEREATISRAQSAAALSQIESIPTDILEARIVNLESQLADAMDAIAKFQKVYEHQKELMMLTLKMHDTRELIKHVWDETHAFHISSGVNRGTCPPEAYIEYQTRQNISSKQEQSYKATLDVLSEQYTALSLCSPY